MNKLAHILENIDQLPSRSCVELIKNLRQHDAVSHLEKTAEVAQTLTAKEATILNSFYKIAAKAPAPGFFSKMWSGAKGMATAEGAAQLASKKTLKGKALERGAKKFDTLGKRFQPAWNHTGKAIAEHPGAAAGTAAGIAGGGYLANRALGPRENNQTVVVKSAEALFNGGWELARTANPRVRPDDVAGTLAKLATVGAVNARLQQAVDSSILSSASKREAVKLGQENNAYCLELLKELVKA
jgi:hypothetical protein